MTLSAFLRGPGEIDIIHAVLGNGGAGHQVAERTAEQELSEDKFPQRKRIERHAGWTRREGRPPGVWERDYIDDMAETLQETSATINNTYYVSLVMLSAALHRSMSVVMRGACSDLLWHCNENTHELLVWLLGHEMRKSLRDWHEIDGWKAQRESPVTSDQLLDGMAEVERLIGAGRCFSPITSISMTCTKKMMANITALRPRLFPSKSAFIRQAVYNVLARSLWPAMTKEDMDIWLPGQEEG